MNAKQAIKTIRSMQPKKTAEVSRIFGKYVFRT